MVKVFEQHSFLYEVEVTVETEPPLVGFPWVRPSDFIRALGKSMDLDQLLGGRRSLEEARPMLRLFWERFEALYPKHQLFSEVRAGKKDLLRCIPCLIHGDEGTTVKKGGVLAMSLQGVVGFGSNKRSTEEVATNNYKSEKEEMRINYVRPGLETRLLMAVCPKDGICNSTTCAKVF